MEPDKETELQVNDLTQNIGSEKDTEQLFNDPKKNTESEKDTERHLMIQR